MRRQQGFALLEVLLATILMMIAAAASYTLVKSFRANSSVQQFLRYSTNITQSFMPFVDGNSYSSVLNTKNQLATSFLQVISIPTEDQVQCSSSYCYVNSGMYLSDATVQNAMSFAVKSDSSQTLASYFIIAVKATGLQVNQIVQSAASLFSIYCPTGASVTLSGQAKCTLQSDAASSDVYSLFLVFPKSGDTAPTDTGLKPPS